MINLSLLLAWLLTDIVSTYGVWHYRRHLTALDPAQATPRVAILTAIKGVSGTTPQFLDRLCQQQYPAYRLVFALESRSDPVLSLIEGIRQRLTGRIEVEVVIAGQATQRAQKVHNLLAALGTLRDDDGIVVFADADILPDLRWLSLLIRPIANGEVAASSGYRWQLPTDRRWPSLIVAAVDLSIATAARSARWNLCWGGSIALDRSVLDQIDLPTIWNRAASDDLTLTMALRARGLKINAPLHVLVPSPVAYTWTSLFSFARRQYLLARTYASRHWLLAGWTLCLPALAAMVAASEIFAGRWRAASFILASIALLQIRLRIRRQIADLLLPDAAIATARITITFAQWAWPLIHLLHLGAFLTSVVGQRFSWAGIEYRLHGRTASVERRTGEA
jgi:cellulose synthase/poly-beta-1,6-N-acetylglucosamine synthase-like glycosyltransferase